MCAHLEKSRNLNHNNESINLDKHWKLVNFCEFDKYATKSYCAIHDVDESLNLGDITKVDETKLADFNMMTWGFPCTDISVAGKQKGFLDEDGNKTRSGMYYEGIRILRYKKPALSIIENVKNLTGKKFKKEFDMVLSDLDEAGYNSYYKVLNAKNYGIPQNRERVFIISIRKDLDNGQFKFPEPFDNGIRLKDILEDEVDEKFYLSDDKVQKFLSNFNQSEALDVKHESKNPQFLGNVNNPKFVTGYAGGVWDSENISPTLPTMQGGGRQPHIITGLVSHKGEQFEKETDTANTLLARDYKGFGNQAMNAVIKIPQATKQGYIECEVGGVADLSYPNSKTRRGKVQEKGTISPTITATETGICKIESPIRIRKLTPRECFRLMGFSDQNFNATKNAGISNSQLYKQAGNSIVVDVLYYIYVELYKAMPYLFDDLKLSSFFSGIGAFEVALDRLYDGINSGNFINPQVE